MSSNEKFILAVTSIGLAAFVVIVAVISLHFSYKNRMIADLIKTGADPMKMHCVFNGIHDRNQVICAALLKPST